MSELQQQLKTTSDALSTAMLNFIAATVAYEVQKNQSVEPPAQQPPAQQPPAQQPPAQQPPAQQPPAQQPPAQQPPVQQPPVQFDPETIPPPSERPFPAVKSDRKSPAEKKLEDLIANGAPELDVVQQRIVYLKSRIKAHDRSLKRLKNMELSTPVEAEQQALAIKYEEHDLDMYRSALEKAEAKLVTLESEPTESLTTGASGPVQICPRGAPAGFMLTELAENGYPYESFIQSGWTDETLLAHGKMIAVEPSSVVDELTLDKVRDRMMELGASVEPAKLMAELTAIAPTLDQVPPERYAELVANWERHLVS